MDFINLIEERHNTETHYIRVENEISIQLYLRILGEFKNMRLNETFQYDLTHSLPRLACDRLVLKKVGTFEERKVNWQRVIEETIIKLCREGFHVHKVIKRDFACGNHWFKFFEKMSMCLYISTCPICLCKKEGILCKIKCYLKKFLRLCYEDNKN